MGNRSIVETSPKHRSSTSIWVICLASAVLTACAGPESDGVSKPNGTAEQASFAIMACTSCGPGTGCGTVCSRLNGDLSSCGASANLCSPAQGPATGVGVNWALASNGGVASSPTTLPGYSPGIVNDGDRSGATTAWWVGSPFPANNCNYSDGNYQYVRVNFNTNHPINEMDIFQLQDNASTNTPTPGLTDSMYALSVYHLQYCPLNTTCTDGRTGTGWVEPPGGYVYAAQQNGANHVWNKLSFPSARATAVRVLIECGFSALPFLVEVEAWDTTAAGVNVAAAANGSSAHATSSFSASYPASATIDGDRSGWNWGSPAQGGGWSDATANTFPNVLGVTFPAAKNISEIDVFGIQDTYWAPAVPTLSLPWIQYGLSNFQVQYCLTGTSCSPYNTVPGTGWKDVPNSPVTGNTRIWSQFTFTAVSATQIRVVVTAGGGGYSRIAEVEAWDYSGAAGTKSSDFATALELRRQMVGETCGSMTFASLSGLGGYYEKCGSNFIAWSAQTGAWSFASPSYISTRYLGGFNLGAWPTKATADMANLGWPAGPYVGSDASGSYVEFQRGIMAAAAGSGTPKVIGGIVGGSGFRIGNSNWKADDALLTSAWLNLQIPNKFPTMDTIEYSWGTTAPPAPPACAANSLYGNRGFYFTTLPDPSGNPTTVTLKDGATNAYVIHGGDQALWSATNCATHTKLGWPVSNEQPYTVNGIASTHQEFEGGTIKYEPSNCTGPNTSQIVLRGVPTHVDVANEMTCTPLSIAYTCTNSDAQTAAGGGYSYYSHCPGISTSGPGATITTTSPNTWFSGITISGIASGCTYVVDEPTYSSWLNAGADGTIDGAIAANPPPLGGPPCSNWAYDTTGSVAGAVPFAWSFCGSGDCANDTPVKFYLQYTTTAGFVSQPVNILTEPAGFYAHPELGGFQQVPGVPNAKNCVYATFGSPLYTTATTCQYLHADSVQRHPARVTLSMGVNANGGTSSPVFVRLQDKANMDSSVAAPYDNYSWLDLPGHPFQSGNSYSFDLAIDHINDMDDITQILVGSTGNTLCVDWLQLTIDDDGVLNNGGDGSPRKSGPGSASRVAYSRNYLNDLGHCIATGNVDFNNYNAPGTALVKVDFNTLRKSPDWQYQHTYWTDVNSIYGGGIEANHFSGFPDFNSLKADVYQEFQTALHENGYHFTPDSPMSLGVADSKSGGNYIVPVYAPSSAVHDVLHTNLYFDGSGSVSFSYVASFDMQLVTHCDSTLVIKRTEAIPMNTSVSVRNWWATSPIISSIPWIIGLIADDVGTGSFSKDLKKLSYGTIPGNNLYRYTWSPQLNGAAGTTDATLWPGFGLEIGTSSNTYCTYIDQ